MNIDRKAQLFYLTKSLLLIGSVSFGGYMALIAMVRDKFVVRDGIVSDNQLSEAITIASLLPGPIAVNVVAHIGYLISGLTGAFLSIAAVLLPSFLMVLMVSIIYIEYESIFNFNPIITGIIPVVIATIFYMAMTLWRKSCTSWFEVMIAILSFSAMLAFKSYLTIIFVLAGAGFVSAFFAQSREVNSNPIQKNILFRLSLFTIPVIIFYLAVRFTCREHLNWQLFDAFAKASITLFGGGYVIVPVLKSLLVDQLNWLSSEDFFFGISIGQVTPGPILISSVFFGYKVNGLAGSFLATAGMFVPTSILMILASHFYTIIQANLWLIAAMNGIRPAIVGLILYSGFSLIFSTHLFAHIEYLVLLVLLVLFLLARFQLSPLKAIILGASFGYLIHLITDFH